MPPPLIAVPGRRVPQGGVAGWPDLDALAVPAAYLRPIQRAGGVPAALLPGPISGPAAEDRLAAFAGLLLIGGSDVDPGLYGQAPHPSCYGIDPIRDAFEIACVNAALRLNLPILAICRGLQVLNVALGGSLEQDLWTSDQRIDHGYPLQQRRTLHPVDLKAGSRIASAMGTTQPECPSYHHQGIDRLAEALTPTGWTADGLVEAAELSTGWVVGVQWHPEHTAASDGHQQRLFDAFVDAVAKGAAPSPSHSAG